MKVRKTKDVIKVLRKKGFSMNPEKNHHQYYYLTIDGKKQAIHTYFSHGKKECNGYIMGQIKKQLKFDDTSKAEDFFDCPLTKDGYVQLLKDTNKL
jgi:predicted RNA binding protein YcfA (HicA-like mRNA interferase family)